MKLYKRTWAEIDLGALEQNFRNYRALLPQSIDIMCVVKAFCYGHGDGVCAERIQQLGVKWFAVSNLDEALRLRRFGITGEILILGYTDPDPDNVRELAENDIIQAIVSEEYARGLSAAAESAEIKNPVRCHAAVDTGMTRIGLRGSAEEIADAVCRINELSKISLCGAFTHYAVADSLAEECISFTEAQAELLYSAAAIASERGVKLDTVHSLNSAGGIFRCDKRSSLARLGIILYGLTPDSALPIPEGFKPVMSLKSVVSRVEKIPAGVSVSYGRTFTTQAETEIATIACGYADGYPRALSNCGEVLLNGRRCRILGRVCMDQFMVDATGAGAAQGDTAILIGSDGSHAVTADDIAALTGTIGYEIVCGISERVPRVRISDGKVFRL